MVTRCLLGLAVMSQVRSQSRYTESWRGSDSECCGCTCSKRMLDYIIIESRFCPTAVSAVPLYSFGNTYSSSPSIRFPPSGVLYEFNVDRPYY